MWWSAGAAASARAGGRRLLDHCFDQFGGGHEQTDGNGTAVPVDTLGTSWEAVETGVHADPLVVRLIYWLVYVLAAVVLLIAMLTTWPPPDRVFPRKRPVARVVPWCLVGRMLGYGVIDWREGKLTPFWRYFRERHELLSLWLGDMQFITFRCRITHFLAGIACTASLSMGLTDLESGRVTGDFWLVQIWVFGALFIYEIVLGIALRVSAVGASERALACPASAEARRVENAYFAACFLFSFACLACSITFVHVMDEGGGCGDGFNTFLAYSYIFGIYEMFGWLFGHPLIITLRWLIGRALLRVSTDAATDDETMECCWKAVAPRLCGCKPQPSAAVDSRGVARDKPERGGSFRDGSEFGEGSFRGRGASSRTSWDRDVEVGIAASSPGAGSRLSSPGGGGGGADVRASAAGFERGLVIGWKKAAAANKAAEAKEAMRAASLAKREAMELRTALAEAQAKAAEAAAAAAAAEAKAAEARAAAAEAAALRLTIPARRPGAPEMDPPTPQSMAGLTPTGADNTPASAWRPGRLNGSATNGSGPGSGSGSAMNGGHGGRRRSRDGSATPSPFALGTPRTPGSAYAGSVSTVGGTHGGTPGDAEWGGETPVESARTWTIGEDEEESEDGGNRA